MSSVTALQLVNRVLLYRRQPPITAISENDPQHQVILNALNMAREDILGTRRWEFDLRHDGQLLTKPTLSSQGITPTFTALQGETSGAIVITGYTASDYVAGDFVVRMVPTDDATYGKTAFRVNTSLPTFSFATLNFPIAMPTAFSSTDCDLVYAEYILPDTVREVVRISHEQDELLMEQIDPTLRFDEKYPSYVYETGEPRSVAIGGFDRRTYLTTEDPDPGLRAIVWPIPDAAYVLTYSYYYRHADFTTGTDELVGVPPDVVNDIVWQATSIVKMAIDGDYAAAHFSDMAQQSASVKMNAYGGSAGRRHTVGSWDSSSNIGRFNPEYLNRLIGS